MANPVSLVSTHEEPPAGSSLSAARLFVIPHAGGSASYYRGWSRWLPDTVELVPLDLPGHATRTGEPLVAEWQHLVDDLTGLVRTRLSGTYVLAGHSLGALLAYEVARTMDARGTPPSLLVASGRNGPAAGLSHRPIHQLPDDQFLGTLERLGGMPRSVAEQADLMRTYLPLLRADLRLAETYTRMPGPPLSSPVAVFAGRQDLLTDSRGLIAWSRETTGTFDLTVVEGGHFFHDEPSFARAARAALGRLGLEEDRRCRGCGARPARSGTSSADPE